MGQVQGHSVSGALLEDRGGARVENQPFAAGFVLDQTDVIAQFGIEVTEAPPFAPFKTYQVAIVEIERLTGLTFKMTGGRSLSGSRSPCRQRDAPLRFVRAGLATTQSTGAPVVPYGYVPLYDGSTIVETGTAPLASRRDHADPGPKQSAGTPNSAAPNWVRINWRRVSYLGLTGEGGENGGIGQILGRPAEAERNSGASSQFLALNRSRRYDGRR